MGARQGFTNVLLEVNNETNVRRYEHEILQPHRVHELILEAKEITHAGRRLLVGTSYGGRKVPEENVAGASTSSCCTATASPTRPRSARW